MIPLENLEAQYKNIYITEVVTKCKDILCNVRRDLVGIKFLEILNIFTNRIIIKCIFWSL